MKSLAVRIRTDAMLPFSTQDGGQRLANALAASSVDMQITKAVTANHSTGLRRTIQQDGGWYGLIDMADPPGERIELSP
jgi:hypothetical protein